MRMFGSVLWAAAILPACTVATIAWADPMPVAPKLSCQRLQDLVAARGGVVLRTSPSTYDRYVSASRFCALAETTEPAWIRSSDDPRCFVGYTCEPYSSDDWR